jgi:parallel beta-helix repeat protein
MKIFIQVILLISVFITTSKISFSTDFFLNPSDDWFSILSGNHLQPGDQVVLSEGIYSDSRRLFISHQGTTQAPIIIRSEDGSTAIITRPNASQNTINVEGAQHLIFRGLEITGGSIGVRIGSKTIDGTKRQAEYITFEECDIHHTEDAAITANFSGDINTGHKFLRNEIHHTGGTAEGFYLGSNNDGAGNTTSVFKDGLIEGNYIHHLNGPTVSQGDGIEIKDGSYNNIIRDNIIHDTNYPGILVYGTDGNAPNIIEGNVIWTSGDNGIQAASEAVIRNNIIFDSAGSGIQSQNHQSAVPGNLTIVHNTIFANAGRTTIRVSQPAGNTLSGPIVIANNALYAMDSGLALQIPNLPGLTVTSNLGVGNSQPAQNNNAWNPSGNPDLDFSDWTNKDVFPANNSLLIGNADSSQTTTHDFNGTVRTNSSDVGAYVYDPNGNPGWQIEPGFKVTLGTILDTDGDGILDSLDNCTEIANPDQHDSNNDGFGNICDADLDNNGFVSFADLNLFRLAFGTNNSDADLDGNGSVSFNDLNIFRALFGKAPGPKGEL